MFIEAFNEFNIVNVTHNTTSNPTSESNCNTIEMVNFSI